MALRSLFTSESVSEGHPDKVADQISDSVLDALLEQDPNSRVAVETMTSTGFVTIAGEVTTKAFVNFHDVVRATVNHIGYTDSAFGLDGNTCSVFVAIDSQSPDIAMGVNTGGAGDQGMMFGFAVDETEELMPTPIAYAHRLTQRCAQTRRQKVLPWMRPDTKSQVTVEYDENHQVQRVDTIVISAQHSPDVSNDDIKEGIMEEVIKKVIPAEWIDANTKFHINPTGRFVMGGPHGDCGLTGRKIIVDTYGGMGRHGGGAFSGKDPTKVDRSAAYAARWVAKNIVAAGLARRAEVQLAYAIGVVEPVSVRVDTFGTGTLPESKLVELVNKHFDLTPNGIIESLDLRRPIYKKTAAYGHFGRNDPDFTWESTHKAEALKADA